MIRQLRTGRATDLRWLPSKAYWPAAAKAVSTPTAGALAAAAPHIRTCPLCGAVPAYLQSGYVDNVPLWWCGACGAIRNAR